MHRLDSALRILDVNFNRAREALRVLEDAARFHLEDRSLTLRLKEMRHALAALFKADVPSMVAARRTATDRTKFDDRSTRNGLADTITANFKRLQEALRSLEEFSRRRRAAVSRLRFKVYDAEQRFSARAPLHLAHLYVILTIERCVRPPLATARGALAGGADMIQLRWERLDDRAAIRLARALRRVARGRLLIINDRADIAQAADADGVHVGESDLSVADARRIVGPGRLVGATTHSIGQARAAIAEGADYLSYGPIRATPTKPEISPVGFTYLEFVKRQGLPFFAIGGVRPEIIPSLRRRGISRVAVGDAVIGASDTEIAARRIKKLLAHLPRPR